MKPILILLLFGLTLLLTASEKRGPDFPQHPKYEDALAKAAQSGKPLLILFAGRKCENPQETNELLDGSSEVKKLIAEQFVFLPLFVDDPTPLPEEEQYISPANRRVTTAGARNQELELRRFDANWQPLWVVVDSTGEERDRSGHLPEENDLVRFLEKNR